MQKNEIKYKIKLYPFGIGSRADIKFLPFNPLGLGSGRGKITEFSRNSARRLRLFLLTQFVGNREMYSFSFTTQEFFTPKEWRRLVKCWNNTCNYYGWAGVWRVELQRRGTPHLHCIFWLINDYEVDIIKEKWLDLVGRTFDTEKFAVKFSSGLNSKWIMYISGHISKHKKEQLGWLGRQWGVWCREQFDSCEIREVELTAREYFQFNRACRGWLRSKSKTRKKSRLNSPVWYRIGLNSFWVDRLLYFIQGQVYLVGNCGEPVGIDMNNLPQRLEEEYIDNF
jgi:hypothetical protein